MKVKRVVELTNEELLSYRQSRLYKLSRVDYRYCDITLEYYKEYFGKTWSDESLIVFDKTGYYIYLALFSNGEEFSFFGAPTDVIYDEGMTVRGKNFAFEELFAKIESIVKEKGIKRLRFFENPYFLHQYYDYEGVSFSSRVFYEGFVDLSQGEEEIKMGVRKSYKSLINWGQKNLEIKIFDNTNMTNEVMSDFENFHIAVSKRRTRSHKSWMLQSEAVKQGLGFVVMGYYESKLVTATLVLNGERNCYYGVCVNDRDLMSNHLPIGHYGLFRSILLAKEKGYSRFDFGDVGNNPDSKINEIVKYKRGFSNMLYSRIACLAEFQRREEDE